MPRDNASKGHIAVFNLLKQMFPHHEIYQEYPYAKILEKAYKRNDVPDKVQDSRLLKVGKRLHADIYDATFKEIFEIQGQQHYMPMIRSKDDTIETVYKRFNEQQSRDNLKRLIAKEADVKLIEIPYTDIDNIDPKYIWEVIEKGMDK